MYSELITKKNYAIKIILIVIPIILIIGLGSGYYLKTLHKDNDVNSKSDNNVIDYNTKDNKNYHSNENKGNNNSSLDQNKKNENSKIENKNNSNKNNLKDDNSKDISKENDEKTDSSIKNSNTLNNQNNNSLNNNSSTQNNKSNTKTEESNKQNIINKESISSSSSSEIKDDKSSSNNNANNNSKTETEKIIIKSAKVTNFGVSYLEGIYLTNSVSNKYNGSCDIGTRENSLNTNVYIYYYKYNTKTKKYVKTTTDKNGNKLKATGIKYINNSKTDGYILMQWFYYIEGVKFYTPIYKRTCSTPNSEIIVNGTYLDKVNSKYSSSTSAISASESILITTANYQTTLSNYNSNSTTKNKVLNDIKTKYIFTAPHSVKQLREGRIKASDVRTGALCETLAKLTNSVCISRKRYDKTDPNYDSYSNSVFQKLVVSISNTKKTRILVDIHGITNDNKFQYAIGTRKGTTVYSGDKCNIEKNLAKKLSIFNPNTKYATASYGNCNFKNVNNIIVTTKYSGGQLVKNVSNKTSSTKLSAVQLEIANKYRTNNTYAKNTIDGIYSFVKDY